MTLKIWILTCMKITAKLTLKYLRDLKSKKIYYILFIFSTKEYLRVRFL